jgi:hypothetical protein
LHRTLLVGAFSGPRKLPAAEVAKTVGRLKPFGIRGLRRGRGRLCQFASETSASHPRVTGPDSRAARDSPLLNGLIGCIARRPTQPLTGRTPPSEGPHPRKVPSSLRCSQRGARPASLGAAPRLRQGGVGDRNATREEGRPVTTADLTAACAGLCKAQQRVRSPESIRDSVQSPLRHRTPPLSSRLTRGTALNRALPSFAWPVCCSDLFGWNTLNDRCCAANSPHYFSLAISRARKDRKRT